VDLQRLVDSDSGRQSWQALEVSLEKYWAGTSWNDQWRRTGSQFGLWQTPETKIAGVSFLAPTVNGRIRAVVLTAEVPEAVIPIHQVCAQLHILGQVTFPVGYPLLGRPGETVAVYRLQYASGKMQTLPVRNGIEVAQANCIDAATRIDPIATAAQPALKYVKDSVREQYQILLWSIPTLSEELVSMRCQLNAAQPSLAIFAITGDQLQG
jgi:hypothetical protein